MNICILSKITLAHSVGGMQIHCKTLSEELTKAGHKVSIITTVHPSGIEHEESNGVKIFYLKNTKPGTYHGGWWRESVQKFEQLHKYEPFDIMLSESISAYSYVRKMKSGWKIPLISVVQGHSVQGDILSEWKRCSTLKEYLHFFCIVLPEYLFYYYPWFWKTLKNSDAIVCVSQETARATKKEFYLPQGKIFVIYNGVDLNIFKPDDKKRETTRNKYNINKDGKLVLMSGVVHKQKGMQVGLKAFMKVKNEFKNIKLMIVGDGQYLTKLKQIAHRYDIGNTVIFCGHVPNHELPGYYNACDLYLNPTLRWEGLPITTVEAIACGKPSVVSRIGGLPSVIKDGFNGFLVPPGNEQMFANKILEILRNESLAEKFAINAREIAIKEFSKEKMAEKYIGICQKLKCLKQVII